MQHGQLTSHHVGVGGLVNLDIAALMPHIEEIIIAQSRRQAIWLKLRKIIYQNPSANIAMDKLLEKIKKQPEKYFPLESKPKIAARSYCRALTRKKLHRLGFFATATSYERIRNIFLKDKLMLPNLSMENREHVAAICQWKGASRIDCVFIGSLLRSNTITVKNNLSSILKISYLQKKRPLIIASALPCPCRQQNILKNCVATDEKNLLCNFPDHNLWALQHLAQTAASKAFSFRLYQKIYLEISPVFQQHANKLATHSRKDADRIVAICQKLFKIYLAQNKILSALAKKQLQELKKGCVIELQQLLKINQDILLNEQDATANNFI